MSKVEDFIDACLNGNSSEVKKLIEHDISIVNKRGSVDWYFDGTGLMMALSRNWLVIVKEILSLPNVNISLTDNYGQTALHHSCSRKSLNLLLEHPECTPE